MTTVHVLGVGLFAPTFPSAAAYFGGAPDGAAQEPAAPHLAGRVRRFTSLVTRMAADVAGQALDQAGIDAKTVRSVFGAARGESQTALALLDAKERGTATSAARFTQSVHSAPSGVWSLAVGNPRPSTTVAAGPDTFAAAWLETVGLLHEDPAPVLLVLADEAVPEALSGLPEDSPLAVAFVVAGPSYAAPRGALARVRGLLPRAAPEPHSFGAHPVAAALPLLAAVVERRFGDDVLAPWPPVADLVPHQPPMLWVDALVDAGAIFAVTRVVVSEASELFEEGAVPSSLALEYMAQTAAAHRGLAARQDGAVPRPGALAGVRDAHFLVAGFPAGTELLVRAEAEWNDGGAATYRCEVTDGGRLVARASLVVVDGAPPTEGAR